MPIPDSEWWRDHYTGLQADLWRAILPREETLRVVEFLLRECRLRPGDHVLDAPCGEGRVALELARRGLRVRGVDISRELLDTAAAAAREQSLAIEWTHGDVRELAGAPCHAVCCLGDSFGYHDDAGNLAFLQRVRAMLLPGGRFALEMKLVAEVLFPRFKDRLSTKVGDMEVEVQRRFDPALGRLAVDYHLRRGGQHDRRTASYRIYACAELCRMLESCGFHDLRLIDAAGAPFALGAERLRLIATAR